MVKKQLEKRMKKEISYLKDYYLDDNVHVNQVSNEFDVVNIFIKSSIKLKYNVKIEVCHDYPFKSPAVYLLNKENSNIIISYADFFKQRDIFYLNKVRLLHYECPCCHNLLCSRNISHPLLEITKDIEKFDLQFKRLRTLYYMKIIRNYIKKLRQDNINSIIEYI
jgi:hypothetical protein